MRPKKKKRAATPASGPPIKTTKPLRRKSPPKTVNSIYKFVVNFFKVVIGLFSIIGFILTIEALKPTVLIEYASSFVPSNQLALPIKVVNQSRFSINVEKFSFQDDIYFSGNSSINNNIMIYNVNRKVQSGEYIDQLCDVYIFPLKPQKGTISVKIFYKYWILPQTRIKEGRFTLRYDREGIIRWRVD